MPVAYLWTRTVRCKNPSCGAMVPLVKQTWLCKKKAGKKSPGRYVALKIVGGNTGEPHMKKEVCFEVVEATKEDGLGFDPAAGSKGGNAICPFCGTVADNDYVKQVVNEPGCAFQPMAIMCVRPGKNGKVYIPFHFAEELNQKIVKRIISLLEKSNLMLPDEPLEANPRSFDVQRYGFKLWRDIFTDRQNLMYLTIAD